MIHTKLGLAALCVVVAGLIGIFDGVAQGATLSWLILNSTHTTATELKAEIAREEISEHYTLDGEIAGLKAAITCKAFTLSGFNLETGGKITEGSKATFTGCKAYKEAPLKEEYAACTVKSSGAAVGTIESKEVKGELALMEGELQMKVEPTAGPTGAFATVRLEGAECAFTELNQIHGTLYFKDYRGFQVTHKLKHLIEPASSSTIYIGGHSAKQLEVTKMLGATRIKLNGAHAGLEWSGMDPKTLSWLVLNSSHTTATELKAALGGENDSQHLTLEWQIGGNDFAITCTAITLNGFNLETGGKITEGSKATFTGCKVYDKAPLSEELKCTIQPPGGIVGEIQSNGLKGELALIGSEVQVKIEPNSGPEGNFFSIRFQGPECVLAETLQFHGTVYVRDGEGLSTVHKLKHLVEVATKPTSLYFGGHSENALEVTKMFGSAWIQLLGAHSGLEWSTMDV